MGRPNERVSDRFYIRNEITGEIECCQTWLPRNHKAFTQAYARAYQPRALHLGHQRRERALRSPAQQAMGVFGQHSRPALLCIESASSARHVIQHMCTRQRSPSLSTARPIPSQPPRDPASRPYIRYEPFPQSNRLGLESGISQWRHHWHCSVHWSWPNC